MAKIISSLPGSTGVLSRTSQLINDGESGSSTYIELNEIGSAAFENISFFATSSQGLLADSSVQPEDISLVATTGNYSDLNNIPITFQPSSHTHVISEVVNLQTVLDGKIDENLPIISGTGTKLTVDTKGLVTNITNATTLDINDSINRRYVTDADIIDIGNLSGINSGDQSSIVGITGTKSQFNTAVTDADILYVGDITQYTDELAQDAVGGILTDTTTIDLSYNDILNIISADIKPNSITSVELADNINISEFVNTTLLPYTGAISNTDLGEYQLKAGQLEFDQTPTGTTGVAILRWNDNEGTLDLGLKGGNVTLQLGQEQIIRIVNKTGVNLLESAYQVIYISGAQGNRLKVDLALANSDLTSAGTIGLVTETINNNEEGFITSNGLVRGINTTGSLQGETWIDGDILYVSPIVAGRLTNIKPIAPQHSITIGICVSAHITQGSIFVKVDNGYELEELHNVLINTPINNQILTYESATSLWKNKTVSDALGFTPVNPILNISTTSPLLGGGNLTADRTLSIQQSTSVQDGYLSSTDFTTFNNKQPAGAYITSLTGEVTASGAGAAVATLSTPAVTGKILTGLNITGGSISATDSILSAFGKVQSQINGVLGGSIFQTTWNASTNTPILTSSIGTKGYYYIVDVAGSTNLDGIIDWKIGDWAIYDGTVWRKVDNTDAVSSVNGFTGAVSLTTSNITEGTNLYYTEGRVSANTDVAANTAVRHNAVTLGTTNGLSLSGQQISLGLSSTSTIGALSSTDWNVFNNKQNALGFTPENITNKSDSYTASSSITYASTKALVDGLNTKAPISNSANYIQNQNSSAQTANMWISGNGRFGNNITLNDYANISSPDSGNLDFNKNTGGLPVFRWYGGGPDIKFNITALGAATFASDINVGGNIGYESSKALYPRTSVVTDWYLGKFDGLNGIDNAVGSGGSFRIGSHIGGVFTPNIDLSATGAAIFASTVTSTSFIKLGGTSSQFLKADGSIDNTIYTPSTGGTGYIQNQNSSAQSANMWINGEGRFNGGIALTPDYTDRALIRAEAGSGNFSVFQYDSGGSYLRKALDINNATGAATFASTVTASNGTLIGGTLTTNYIPKATGSGTLGNSNIIDEGSGILITAKIEANGYGKFQSSYSSYTGDGLFDANALPTKIQTPSGRFINFGYVDYGSGQYNPRIGFTNNTNWSLGSNGSDGNSFSISTGSSDDKLTISNTGAATFAQKVTAQNFQSTQGYLFSNNEFSFLLNDASWYQSIHAYEGIFESTVNATKVTAQSDNGGFITKNAANYGWQIMTGWVSYFQNYLLFGNQADGKGMKLTPNGDLQVDGTVSASNGTLLGGTGIVNYIPKFTTTGTLGNSLIQDDGTRALVSGNFRVDGTATFANNVELSNGRLYQFIPTSTDLRLYDASFGLDLMKFGSTGNVLIGTTTDNNVHKLQIAGSILCRDFIDINSSENSILLLNSTSLSGGKSWNITSRNDGYFLMGRTGISNDFYFDPIGNATFSNKLTVNNSAYFGTDFWTTGDTGLWFNNNTYTAGITGRTGGQEVGIFAGSSERLRVASNGNVGIGTATPSTKLTISGSDDAAATGVLEITTSGGTNLKIGGNTTYSWIQSHQSKPLYINILGNNTIINGNSGNVGIGTTTPEAKLQVYESSVLGSNVGDYKTILRTDINTGGTQEALYTWGYRERAGSDWSSTAMMVGVGMTGYHSTPGVDSRLWWKLDPYTHKMHWGGQSLAKMTLNNLTGNVGIGTTSPTEKLHTFGSGVVKNLIQSSDNQVQVNFMGTLGQIVNNNGSLYLTNEDATSPIIFRTGSSTERMRITSTGAVGIGVDVPLEKLHVLGKGMFDGVSSRLILDASTDNIVKIHGFNTSYVNKPIALNSEGSNVLIGTSTDNSSDRLQVNGSIYASTNLTTGGYVYSVGSVTGNAFYKAGGTSTQFLKADGSVDSTIYAADDNVVHVTGNEEITGNKFFSGSISTDTDITISGGASLKFNLGTYESSLSSQLLTGNRGYDLPDTSGTIALVETVKPYKVYTALLSQSGTSAPTAIVLENTLGGTVVWTRDAVGVYRGTLTGAFNQTKTVFFTVSNYKDSGVLMQQASSNDVTIGTFTTTSTPFTAADSIMGSLPIEIRVYN